MKQKATPLVILYLYEGMLGCWESIWMLSLLMCFEGWLYRMCVTTACDELRSLHTHVMLGTRLVELFTLFKDYSRLALSYMHKSFLVCMYADGLLHHLCLC